MTTAIEKSPTNSMSVETLIAQAIDRNVPVETMEKLLSMRRELKAEFAKEAFDLAMASFQTSCPVIDKKKHVKNKDGTKRYSYAPLESIVAQVKPHLQANGFSYSIEADVQEGWVTAICRVTHSQGHSESSSFKVPTDKDSYMNAPQKFASALTFAKRYAFCNAFGILTGDEDDDSLAVEVKGVVPQTRSQQKATEPHEAKTVEIAPGATVAQFDPANEAITKGKYAGVVWKDIPRDYLVWVSGNATNREWKEKANATLQYLDAVTKQSEGIDDFKGIFDAPADEVLEHSLADVARTGDVKKIEAWWTENEKKINALSKNKQGLLRKTWIQAKKEARRS